jgi:hypothetical protein
MGCLSLLLIVAVLVTGYKVRTDNFVLETHACRMCLLCWRPNWMRLVSQDSSPLIATQGRLFLFSHRRRMLLLLV